MLNAIPPDLFFCGIAGSGMSALAALLSVRGHRVRGSDRSIDAGTSPAVVAALRTMGIQTSPQDGSGVGPGTGAVVVSSAVESDIPDVVAAKALGIPVVTRAELLARVFNQGVGVAVGGTSGKTTVTGMIAHVLRENGRDPTVINGGRMLNSLPCDPLSSVWTGDSELTVIEADESDGSIAGYNPAVAAVTTVSLDHLPMAQLEELFEQFVCRSSVGAVVNQGWGTGRSLAGIRDGVRTFGLEQPEADLNAEALRPSRDGIRFTCRGKPYELAVLGRHNVANAVCAAGCCELLGVEVSAALAALATFRGIGRRLERLGQTTSWMTVYDDFAHNPEKIAASLSTLKEQGDAVRVFYQPHGFKPTAMFRDELVAVFARYLEPGDLLLMPPIYYAGGTATVTVSSRELVAELAMQGVDARFVENRDQAEAILRDTAERNATVVVMGARDPSLTTFAERLLST